MTILSTARQDILDIAAKIVNGVEIVAEEFVAIGDFLGSHAEEIASGVSTLLTFVEATNVGGPGVNIALESAKVAVNEAAAALEAFHAAHASGSGAAAAALDAITAFHKAQATVAAAKFVATGSSAAAPATDVAPTALFSSDVPPAPLTAGVLEAGRKALRSTFPIGYAMADDSDIVAALTLAFDNMLAEYEAEHEQNLSAMAEKHD